MADPRQYVSKWHSFDADLKPDATIHFVGTHVRSIKHWCELSMFELQKQAGVGPAFMKGMAPEGQLTEVVLEKPIEQAPRSGYCKHCNEIWVGEEEPRG